MAHWLCCPKILFVNLLTVIQPGFGRKKEEAWTLQQQSTSVYAECALNPPSHTHTHARTHAHTHTHTASVPSFDVSTELLHSGSPLQHLWWMHYHAAVVMCLFLFRCCSTLGTPWGGGPGNPFVALSTWALPWALLIRRSEWLWDKSVCVCFSLNLLIVSLCFLTFYVANKKVHQNTFDIIHADFV